MRYVIMVFLLVFFFISIIFFYQNGEALATELVLRWDLLDFYSFKSIPLPFYFIVLASFFIGSLITIIYFLLEKTRVYSNLRKMKKENKKLQQELSLLRPQEEEEGEEESENTEYASTAGPTPQPSEG